MNQHTNFFEKLSSMIFDIKFAMLSTVTEDGTIHSRPMGTIDLRSYDFPEEGILWFFSRKNSFKNSDISADQHVNLAFFNPDKQRYISVSGRAFISFDKEKMKVLWNPILKAWLPLGLEDPEISLIGVKVDEAEMWDSPPSKVVQLVGFVKAAVTGKPYDDKHKGQHIDLRQ